MPRSIINMRFIRYLAAATVAIGLAGCENVIDLDVQNINNPDRPRILTSPAENEALASAQFQQIVSAWYGALARPHLAMMTMAFENAAALNNNGMGPRSEIPRNPIDNSRGNQFDVENFATFRILHFVARNASDVLGTAGQQGFQLGTGEPGLNRLRGWSHFISGIAHGGLAMTHDSAAIARPTDAPADIPVLSSYTEVGAFAIAQLDSALLFMQRPGVLGIPSGWLTGPGGPEVTPADFQRVIRSYRAQIRAGIARNPTERAAVDWAAVIADAEAGIQSDLVVSMNRNQNWDYHWLHTAYHYRDANWHQMPYHIIGMADNSGGYSAWLATGRDARTPFLIVTPDLRFPQGATRAAQNADRGGQGAPTGGKYFRNREPGLDAAGIGWRNSQYDHYRFRAYADANGVLPHPIFTRAENDMLAAEGHIRRNNFSAAAALIDRTRVPNGLPALAGVVTSGTQAVPGGADCVPKVPQPPAFASAACGTIIEAMKWEKRMESAYTSYGAWYFDSRGWGDLPVGTPVSWPVPVQEIDARRGVIYNLGGVEGNQPRPGGAGPSNYGFGTGDR
jgi:hypothetical protein